MLSPSFRLPLNQGLHQHRFLSHSKLLLHPFWIILLARYFLPRGPPSFSLACWSTRRVELQVSTHRVQQLHAARPVSSDELQDHICLYQDGTSACGHQFRWLLRPLVASPSQKPQALGRSRIDFDLHGQFQSGRLNPSQNGSTAPPLNVPRRLPSRLPLHSNLACSLRPALKEFRHRILRRCSCARLSLSPPPSLSLLRFRWILRLVLHPCCRICRLAPWQPY